MTYGINNNTLHPMNDIDWDSDFQDWADSWAEAYEVARSILTDPDEGAKEVTITKYDDDGEYEDSEDLRIDSNGEFLYWNPDLEAWLHYN